MDLRRAPALVPAACFVAGVAAAPALVHLSLPLLVTLAALAAAARHRLLTGLAWAAAGLAWSAAIWVLPEREPLALDLEAPVEVHGRVAGFWSERELGGSVRLEAHLVRQGVRLWVGERLLRLDVGEDVRARPELGRGVVARGYLARSPGYANFVTLPPGPWRLRVKSDRFLAERDAPPPLACLSGLLRGRVEEALRQVGSAGPGVALTRALVIGEESGIAPAVKRGLKRAGAYHVLSVSGLHVALVAGAAWLLGGLLPRAVRWLPVALSILLYLLLVGPLPALLRASVMGLLGLAAWGLGRPAVPGNALAVAVVVLVAGEPSLVADLGFQLSVSATAGLVLLAPAIDRRWHNLRPTWLRRGVAATVGAQIASLPWLLPAFPMLSLWSPLLNLMLVPWTGVALGLALPWTLLSLIAPAAARAAIPLLDAVAAPFAWPDLPSAAALATVRLPLSPLAATAFAIALAGLLLTPRPRPALAALFAVALGALGDADARLRPEVEVAAFDVGQGDALLLRDGATAVLVDGGGSRGRDLGATVLVPALARLGVTELAAVILTHADFDHCGGLVETLTYLPATEVWLPEGLAAGSCLDELLARSGPRHRFLRVGDRLQRGRWRFEVLWPEAGRAASDNDRSLVVRATAAGRSLLLTGDIEEASERILLRQAAAELSCDLLKVAHHGSKTSTSAAFVAAARPRLALVSAGARNPFGHPTAAVVERLRAQGAWVLRTDRDGLVLLRWSAARPLVVELPGTPRG